MTHIAHISPVAWQHINFYGRYEFTKASEPINMEEIVEALAHHPIHLDVDEGDAWLKPSAPFRGVCKNPQHICSEFRPGNLMCVGGVPEERQGFALGGMECATRTAQAPIHLT